MESDERIFVQAIRRYCADHGITVDVRAGGWLILDDYFWLHGNGPQRVGDAILTERAADISRAFVCGRALFLKFDTADAN